jgi:hypothetical protein
MLLEHIYKNAQSGQEVWQQEKTSDTTPSKESS